MFSWWMAYVISPNVLFDWSRLELISVWKENSPDIHFNSCGLWDFFTVTVTQSNRVFLWRRIAFQQNLKKTRFSTFSVPSFFLYWVLSCNSELRFIEFDFSCVLLTSWNEYSLVASTASSFMGHRARISFEILHPTRLWPIFTFRW